MAPSKRTSGTGKKKQNLLSRFWAWYERHYTLNITLTAAIFSLQLVHLYWLTANVVMFRLLGQQYFPITPFWEFVIIIVDYTEIPSLLSTTVLYFYEMRKGWSFKSALFLLMVNSQWLHLFWITDEFVVNQFTGVNATVLPFWLAWVAIFIDYLELPVIFDTIVRSGRALAQGKVLETLKSE